MEDKFRKSAQSEASQGAANAARVQPPSPQAEEESEEIETIYVNMVRVGIQEIHDDVDEDEVAKPGCKQGGWDPFVFGTNSHPSNSVSFQFSGQQAPSSTSFAPEKGNFKVAPSCSSMGSGLSDNDYVTPSQKVQQPPLKSKRCNQSLPYNSTNPMIFNSLPQNLRSVHQSLFNVPCTSPVFSSFTPNHWNQMPRITKTGRVNTKIWKGNRLGMT